MGRWIAVIVVALASAGCMVGSADEDPFGPGSGQGVGSGDGTGSGDGSDAAGSEQTGDTGGEGSTGVDESTGEPPPPPFDCEPVSADSPILDGVVLFDPAQPHPGDTLNVIVRATNGLSRTDAPPMDLEVTSGAGIETLSPQTIEGGEALYYYSIPDVSAGDVCLRGLIDGSTEVGATVEVTPRPDGPPIGAGIYKVVTNHMWTCDEQPTFGNELHVWVRDENGQGLEGVTVALDLADSTDLGSIYNGEAEQVPAQIVTGPDGHAMAFNYWPISDNGLLVFNASIEGAASDVATELTTGWWETDNAGCNFCNTGSVNVWGHWSYTVQFQRDPTATEICVVDNDHAGMTACGEPRHIHHHPDVRACWAP